MESDLFARQLKDALVHFYEPAHLQTHPLASLVVGADSRMTSPNLRQLLLDAIELLKPTDELPYDRPEWFAYRILHLRYLDMCSRDEICQELGLSRTSYYRYHNEAVSALASLLRERYVTSRAGHPEPDEREQTGDRDGEHDEAIKLAQTLPRDRVGLQQIVDGVKETLLPLTEQQGINLSIECLTPLACVYGALTILRQIAIGILSEVINSDRVRGIAATVRGEREFAVWQIEGLPGGQAYWHSLLGSYSIALSATLLREYGGQVWLEQDARGTTLLFTFPSVLPKAVLVIDDDLDTVRLYQEYLAGMHCVVLDAELRDGIDNLLNRTRPSIVLLDVLMPGQDGWSILQRLRSHDEWKHVPVVICSVLSQPQLALALGAAAVLQKPIDAQDLRQAVETLLAK